MSSPQQYPLDTGVYLETLEEELVTANNRARVYRTQVKQLERLLVQYRDHFGELPTEDSPRPTSVEEQSA